MKNMKITTAAFAATHPYREERRAFARLFPGGTTWDELIKKAVTGYLPAQDILCWWASSAPSESADFEMRLAAKRLCGTPQVALAHFAIHCPADVPGATLEARLAVQEDQFYRVLCAHHCPAGVPGADWDARLAIMSTPGQRRLLGRVCPAGVPGADWAARLAVQRNAEDREYLGQWCPAGVPGATLEARLAVQMDDRGREWVTEEWGGRRGCPKSTFFVST